MMQFDNIPELTLIASAPNERLFVISFGRCPDTNPCRIGEPATIEQVALTAFGQPHQPYVTSHHFRGLFILVRWRFTAKSPSGIPVITRLYVPGSETQTRNLPNTSSGLWFKRYDPAI